MAESRNARLITKRTSVPGKIPTGTTGDESSFIRSGELASNLADHSLWGYDGTDVFEYGFNSFLGLTGGTISGPLYGTEISATTFSGGTILSGSTNLYSIFQSIGADSPHTQVQPGANIITGGTSAIPIVGVAASPSFNNLTFSGTATGNILSATTMSANTISLQSSGLIIRNPANTFSNIFTSSAIAANRTITIPLLIANDTLVTAAFAQTLTNKTLTSPVINTQISGTITGGGNITATNFLVGATAVQTLTNKTFVTLSGGTISGGTIYSGSTNLYDIFATKPDQNDITRVQPGTNTTTGGTTNNPTVNLIDSPSINNLTFSGTAIGGSVQAGAGTFTSLSATTLSGGTIFSGSTNLSSLFGSQVNQTTLQNQMLTKANLSGATFTGAVVAPSLSATTISGGTIFSGSTNLSTIFHQKNGYLLQKSGAISGSTFSGNPKKGVVTFATPFSNNNYSVSVISDISRVWSIESKTASGFTISSNSNPPLDSSDVYWTSLEFGEGFK